MFGKKWGEALTAELAAGLLGWLCYGLDAFISEKSVSLVVGSKEEDLIENELTHWVCSPPGSVSMRPEDMSIGVKLD